MGGKVSAMDHWTGLRTRGVVANRLHGPLSTLVRLAISNTTPEERNMAKRRATLRRGVKDETVEKRVTEG
jgi:hypothetical protein